jgi:cell division protein FtsQ
MGAMKMSRQRAFANQEREFQARRFGKLGRALTLMLASALSLVALGLFVADQLYRPDTFQIDQIKIIGQFRYLEPSTVEAVVVKKVLGNFFSIDLDDIRVDVESISWVESVDVRREWPDTLVLAVREHRPAMRWGSSKWVSTLGTIIDLPEEIDTDAVIELHGNSSQAKRIMLQAARWKFDLAKQGLEVREVGLSESEAWTLKLYYPEHNSEFDLLLGHEEIAQRLQRFEFLFDKRFRFSDRPIKRVDARYPDGLAVEQAETKLTDTRAISDQQIIASNTEH